VPALTVPWVACAPVCLCTFQVPQLTEEELEAKRKQRAKDRARTLAIANEQIAPDPEVCIHGHRGVGRIGSELSISCTFVVALSFFCLFLSFSCLRRAARILPCLLFSFKDPCVRRCIGA
jgi:hypothetical protein